MFMDMMAVSSTQFGQLKEISAEHELDSALGRSNEDHK
jgi:hypothetical protein